MIEDATKPNIEPFELYDDFNADLSEQYQRSAAANCAVSVERSAEPVMLDLKDAAYVLGKSMRALERSLSGKWGNKLPDGWSAKKAIVNENEEWQIMPPVGFNLDGLVEHKRNYAQRTGENGREQAFWPSRQLITKAATKLAFGKPIELHLLRELAATHKELSEERRAHLDDLRLLAELQSSMRLLEINAADTANLKADLLEAQKDLISLKNQYQLVLNMPWWKRIFVNKP
jgi:hypothetical protein